jgi:hypothetical protein
MAKATAAMKIDAMRHAAARCSIEGYGVKYAFFRPKFWIQLYGNRVRE